MPERDPSNPAATTVRALLEAEHAHLDGLLTAAARGAAGTIDMSAYGELRAGLLRPRHHRVRPASHRLYREQVLPLIECRQLLAHGRLKWFITSRFTVD